MKNSNKGITLIALVITIIVLIILAGVSINLVLGENGIITRAKSTKEISNITKISEKLELKKAEVAINNNNIITLENYIEEIKKSGIIKDENINSISPSRSIIIVEEKYHYLLEEEKNENLKITYIGTVERLKPIIVNTDINYTTDSIIVKVNTLYAEGGTYKFSIKDTQTGEYEEKSSQLNSEYEYTSLQQNKKYYLKIEVIGTDGESTTIELSNILSNITYTCSTDNFTNQDVIVTINSTLQGYTLQTSKDGKNWETTNIQTYIKNGPIYVRVLDNTEIIYENIVGNVEKIDKTIPNDATIVISGNTLQTTSTVTLSATVTHNDDNVDISQCKYILNTTQTEIGTSESNYTGGAFNQNGETIQLENMTSGTYYLHILTTDKAQNKKETIKGPIQITENLHAHTGDSTSGGGCYGEANMVSVPYQEKVQVGWEQIGSTPAFTPKYEYVTKYKTEQQGWKTNCGKIAGNVESYNIIY